MSRVPGQEAAPSFPSPGEAVIFQPAFVEFGGEERVILSLSEELHAQGKPHSVLCYHDRIDLGRHARLPLRVHSLQPGNGPARAWALRRALQRLHRMGSPTPVLFNIQSALHAGLSGAKRYHLRIPDTYSLLSPSPWRREPWATVRSALRDAATRRGVQGAQRLLTNTRALATELNDLYGREAQVHFLGGQGHAIDGLPVRSREEVNLLSVCRLQSSKRIDWMLQALAEESEVPWRLHIAGTGPERNGLEALTRNLGIAPWVQFHGFVSDDELERLYRQAHVFLMPARQGFGLPAIEALYRRCTVVLNRESGVSEILEDTPWVLIAEPGPAGFSSAVRMMLRRLHREGPWLQPLPPLPTMKGWAADVIDALGW